MFFYVMFGSRNEFVHTDAKLKNKEKVRKTMNEKVIKNEKRDNNFFFVNFSSQNNKDLQRNLLNYNKILMKFINLNSHNINKYN